MRVLVISHPAVAPAYRRKFERIAASPGVDLRLIVPEAWPEENRRVEFDSRNAPDWVAALPIAFEGYYTRYFFRRGLAAHFKDFQPDIVHVEEEPYSLSAGQALRMTRRYVPQAKFIFRTSISADIRLKMFALPFLRLIERSVFRRAACAFVLSERAAEVMRLHGYRGETRIFPNGVDTAVFRPLGDAIRSRIRRELDMTDSFVAGFVGRLIPLKGVETLVEAASRLPNMKVLLVGEGEHRSVLEELAARRGMADRVTFAGSQPPHRVVELMNAMDVFVLPSRTSPVWVEFFGRVAVEAMACGVPVLGSSSGEIPTTIGDAGIIFPEGNADALRESLHIFQKDPLRVEMYRQRGFERVRTLYAWEAVSANTLRAYREICERA